MSCNPGRRLNISTMLQEVGNAGASKAMAANLFGQSCFFYFPVNHMKNVLAVNCPVRYDIAAPTQAAKQWRIALGWRASIKI